VELLFLNDVYERFSVALIHALQIDYLCTVLRQFLSGGKTMTNPANIAGASYCVKTFE